jgi:hypothetical protein
MAVVGGPNQRVVCVNAWTEPIDAADDCAQYGLSRSSGYRSW